ncbi:MAG: S-layer family protein, partial [Coleofasciculus sp. S288]|nr:S-layer family protein [Coleofasciculus sp. S288]
NFGTIELSGIASVNASGLGGGAIRVRGGNVTLRDRSNLVSDTLGSFAGRGIDIQAAQFRVQDQAFVSSSTVNTGAGGNLTIRATDGVELRGSGFDTFRQTYIEAALAGTVNPLARTSGLFAGTVGSGRAGNITIDTQQLTLRDGAVIFSPTFSQGAGGSIAINASELIDVNGSGLLTTTLSRGDAGTLEIDTGKLIVQDGAIVSTLTLGMGDGGNLSVRASESVVVSGYRDDSPIQTNLSTSTVGSTGDAGDLEINTRSLFIEGGAAIATTSGVTARNRPIPSNGRGGNLTIASDSVRVTGTSVDDYFRSLITTSGGNADAGDLTINTNRLIIQDGAGVGASTLGAGQGGDVIVNASESVEVIGKSRDGRSPSTIATSTGYVFTPFFIPINATGAAGNLSITTGELIVRDGSLVNLRSSGSGDAGSVNVIADAIALDTGSSIDATTVSGAGGNINLQAQDIRLRRESQIRTDAGSSDGGNIAIDTDTLVALENSDITANAMAGSGGRVSITAQGIFGTQFREELTLESDITATSDRDPQFNGIVDIDIQGIDPSQGLVQLPDNVIDPSQQIATGCPANQGNYFALTGRGGLPAAPTQPLLNEFVWQDTRNLSVARESESVNQTQEIESKTNPNRIPIVEAQGWRVRADGQLELVASVPDVAPPHLWHQRTTCAK